MLRNSDRGNGESLHQAKMEASKNSDAYGVVDSLIIHPYTSEINTQAAASFLEAVFGDLPETAPYFHLWANPGRITAWCTDAMAAMDFVTQNWTRRASRVILTKERIWPLTSTNANP